MGIMKKNMEIIMACCCERATVETNKPDAQGAEHEQQGKRVQHEQAPADGKAKEDQARHEHHGNDHQADEHEGGELPDDELPRA